MSAPLAYELSSEFGKRNASFTKATRFIHRDSNPNENYPGPSDYNALAQNSFDSFKSPGYLKSLL